MEAVWQKLNRKQLRYIINLKKYRYISKVFFLLYIWIVGHWTLQAELFENKKGTKKLHLPTSDLPERQNPKLKFYHYFLS